MRFNTIGQKIGIGFTIIVSILALSIGLTILQFNKIENVTDRINNLRKPTSTASLKMLVGINKSLAALRGWMILGKDSFVKERKEAWKKHIDEPLNTLKELSKNWTNPKNVTRLVILEKKLEIFRTAQQEVEKIAQTPENLPANKILFDEAAPLASEIIDSITKLIELEMLNPNSVQRKGLFKSMADFRGSMGMTLANIRAFLIKNDIEFKTSYTDFWKQNNQAFNDIKINIEFLNPKQLIIFNNLEKARKEFKKLPPKLFSIRSSSKWNKSQYLLSIKAAPVAKEIKIILQSMSENQLKLMDDDLALNKQTILDLNNLLIFVFILSVTVSSVIGFWLKRKIKNAIQNTVDTANQISMGNLDNEIKTNDIHEINLLGNSMREMQQNLNILNTELEEKERRMQGIIDTTVSPMITIDKNGIIEGFNKSAQTLFEYSESEVLGKNV